MVPSNLNVSLNLHAHNANYGLGYMQNATAAINVTPKSVAFNDVKFRSNLADVDMDFVYHTPDSTHAEVTLKFCMNKMNAGGLIKILPAVPKQLRTFDGIFDAALNARWRIDSLMNIEIPSVKSTGSITGRKLSINKKNIMPKFLGWLFFGSIPTLNIDSIRFYVDIDNNILTVSPFVINLNRYKLQGHGIMRNDQMFYQVNLLHSPIRLKLGIYAFGLPYDMHYRLGSTRLWTPAEMLKRLESFPNRPLSLGLGRKIPGYKKNAFNDSTVRCEFPKIFSAIKNIIYNSVALDLTDVRIQQQFMSKQLLEKTKNKKSLSR